MNLSAVIIGAGQAGVQTALSLRDEGFEGDITLINDEPDLPYQRPPLSKAFLLGKVDEPGLALKGDAVYRDYGVQLLSGVSVVRLDPASRQIHLNPEGVIGYDRLVLATGARQRRLNIPGEDLVGVVHLRSLSDARDIAIRLPDVRRAVVIGAGFIGLEFAAVARARDIEVTVVELGRQVLGRALSTPTASFFEDRHRTWGAQLLFGVKAVRFEGEAGVVRTVVLDSGLKLDADLVIVGAGAVPDTTLAEAAGLEVSDGVVVDTFMQTSDPAIWAVGDCARHPNRFCSTCWTRVESVQNATDQAKTAAAAIVGRPEPYAAVPWFWSDQGDVKLQIAGLSSGYDETVMRGDPASGAFSVFCFQNGRLLAVESVNRGADHVLARRLLQRSAPITPEQAADEHLPLKSLMPAV
jgi:3-phenylpropionate/trans-cinnamate dioxygenase ferredoxin reductase subunit